jgi:pSer/pThr/pTyr-binding forkhead associated (FHA) protein
LHAAEDSVHRLEAEVRIKSARLDELAKPHDDSRGMSATHEVAQEGAAPVFIRTRTHTIIEDLNSTNGVTVNGRRVLRQTLKDGDIVLIGKAPFRFAMRHVAERR